MGEDLELVEQHPVLDDPSVLHVQLLESPDVHAAAECIRSWVTDFTGDLAKVTVPTLVVHGDSDAIVPIEVSGRRTHEAVAGSELVVIEDGPHGINTSHPDEFNAVAWSIFDPGHTLDKLVASGQHGHDIALKLQELGVAKR